MLYTVLTLQKRTVLWFTDRACLQTAASLHMIGKYAISMLAVEFMDCLSLVCLFARFLWIVVKCWKKKMQGKKILAQKVVLKFFVPTSMSFSVQKKIATFARAMSYQDLMFYSSSFMWFLHQLGVEARKLCWLQPTEFFTMIRWC